MKRIALFVTVLGLICFSLCNGVASDAAKPSPADKPAAQTGAGITAHQPAAVNETSSHANEKLKMVQSHNTALSSPPKSSLPVNAGQQHRLAVVGGTSTATTHKTGAIDGTELKRSR